MTLNYIHLPEASSTNTLLMEAIARGECPADETVLWTTRQTAGRGQTGNRWESAPGENLAFSMLLMPTWMPPSQQFILSELTCLAVADTLEQYVPGFCVKWPNDIYHDDRKVCGILIENRIVASHLGQCVVGVGINVNQIDWEGVAPNPVSVRQLVIEQYIAQQGSTPDMLLPADTATVLRAASPEAPAMADIQVPRLSIERILNEVTARISRAYHALPSEAAEIHRRFIERLYRREGLHPYVDVATGRPFMARLQNVEPDGHLILVDADGQRRRYMFKEVHFVLPCGVTKE